MWKFAVSLIFDAFKLAIIELGKRISQEKEINNVEFKELKDLLECGDIKFGDKIEISGTYSEYVPFINLARLNNDRKDMYDSVRYSTPGACKIQSLENEHMGSLLEEDVNFINTYSNCIPLFYSDKYSKDSINTMNYLTGDMIKFTCQVYPLPSIWEKIMIPTEYFKFDRGDQTSIPFCLKILDADRWGIHLDEFYTDFWSIFYIPELQTERLSLQEIAYLQLQYEDEFFVENPFPDSFELIYPHINIFTEEYKNIVENINDSLIEFPKLYNRTGKLFNKGISEPIHNISVVHSGYSEKLTIEPLMKYQINTIDIKYENSMYNTYLSDIPLDIRFYYWEKISSLIFERVKKIPRALGDKILLGELKSDILKKFTNMDENDRLATSAFLSSWNVLGFFIRQYGYDSDSVSSQDISNLTDLMDHDDFRVWTIEVFLQILTLQGLTEAKVDNNKLVYQKINKDDAIKNFREFKKKI